MKLCFMIGSFGLSLVRFRVPLIASLSLSVLDLEIEWDFLSLIGEVVGWETLASFFDGFLTDFDFLGGSS